MPKIDEVKQATERINAIINGVSEERRGEVYQELSNLPGCRSTKQDITDILRSNSLAFPKLPKGQITDTEEALDIVHRFDDCLSSRRSLAALGSASESELKAIQAKQRKVFTRIVKKLEGLETETWESKSTIANLISNQRKHVGVALIWKEHSVSIGVTKRVEAGYFQMRTTGKSLGTSKLFPKLLIQHQGT